MNIPIDFLVYQPLLKIKKEEKSTKVFCPIRKKYLVFQPEELVRQLVVYYLIQNRGYSKNSIHVERGVKVNNLSRRLDIIIYNKAMMPFLMVECKRPKVKITQAVFDQIAQYNLTLNVQYLVVTNGMETFCCQMDYDNQTYHFIEEIPQATEM